jgi:hypothetical protein
VALFSCKEFTLAWPPELNSLKSDLGIDESDTRDDARLTTMLNAAVAYVERVRPEFDYADLPVGEIPTDDLILGTIRLAGRWHTRRRSPDGLVNMAELGASRVPSFDPDIEKLLGVGRYRAPVIA